MGYTILCSFLYVFIENLCHFYPHSWHRDSFAYGQIANNSRKEEVRIYIHLSDRRDAPWEFVTKENFPVQWGSTSKGACADSIVDWLTRKIDICCCGGLVRNQEPNSILNQVLPCGL